MSTHDTMPIYHGDTDAAFPTSIAADRLGLTKREWFAGNAPDCVFDFEGTVVEAARELGIDPSIYSAAIHWPQLVARRAARYADALLAELAKEPQP